MMDLTQLALTDAQREVVEGMVADAEARAAEAFLQLADARAQLAAHRHGARDAAVCARLVDADADLDAQFEALRAQSPYLFEPKSAASSGGARIAQRPLAPRADMNSVLRGR